MVPSSEKMLSGLDAVDILHTVFYSLYIIHNLDELTWIFLCLIGGCWSAEAILEQR
jgi:hypothetical protein